MLLASSLKNNLHVLIFKAESHNSIYLKGKNIICVTSHAKAKDQSSNSNQWRARLVMVSNATLSQGCVCWRQSNANQDDLKCRK